MRIDIHLSDYVWSVNEDLCYIEETVDRFIITLKSNPDEKLIIFSSYVSAIEYFEDKDVDYDWEKHIL